MPITPTEKIWMNGELVDWDDAKIHILTHTLHYGTGVFEGIRAYETADGPAIFRLTDHIDPLLNSAQILMMACRTRSTSSSRRRRTPCAPPGCRRATSGRSPTTATARWGSTRLPCSVDVAIACWPWGAYLGDDAATKGVRMKISSWTRHDHNTMPPASKTTGNYVNSSLAKVEALKAGYDEAIMLNPQGLVSECTGENIFVARNGVHHHAAAVGRRARGHHAGQRDDDRPRPRLRVPRRRADAQRPLHRRRDVRVRHRGRGERGELGRRPTDSVPGPMTTAIADEYTKAVRGQVDRYKDWVEHVS